MSRLTERAIPKSFVSKAVSGLVTVLTVERAINVAGGIVFVTPPSTAGGSAR